MLPSPAPAAAMATGLLVGLQQDQAHPLVSREQLHLFMDLPVQDSRDQGPERQDVSVTLPRQEPPGTLAALPFGGRSDSEEIPSYISENMTITSADEEKVRLLNRNTELRQRNKELLELSQAWYDSYHYTRTGLQRQVADLQREVDTLRAQARKLSAKLDHEQSRKEYYEHSLLQELRHTRVLQEYVRQLEGGQLRGRRTQFASETKGSAPFPWEEPGVPLQCAPPRRSFKGKGMKPKSPAPLNALGSKIPEGQKHMAGARHAGSNLSHGWEEVLALKDQLEALKFQTEIYETEYRTEQEDRLRVKAENLQLRKEEQEMRQRMALLEEQLRVFEEDFRKERSDKQVLQRLLKRNAATQGSVLLPAGHDHRKNCTACPQGSQYPPALRDKPTSFCRDG